MISPRYDNKHAYMTGLIIYDILYFKLRQQFDS